MSEANTSERGDAIEVNPLTIAFTAYYAVQAPLASGGPLPALVIALHGWGQNGKRFLRDFAPLRKRNILVAAPFAPHQFYLDMVSKKVGFNWLTVYDRDRAIADVNTYLSTLMAVLRTRHAYDPARVFALGFSQGSAMAYRFAVAERARVAGVISCCADLPPDVEARLPGLPPLPALVLRGTEDTLFGEEKAAAAVAALSAHGHPGTLKAFPAGHELTPAMIEAIGDWIAAQ